LKSYAVVAAVLLLVVLVILLAFFTLKDTERPPLAEAPLKAPAAEAERRERAEPSPSRPERRPAQPAAAGASPRRQALVRDEEGAEPPAGRPESSSEDSDAPDDERVEARHELRIFGIVTNEVGEPLIGVRVVPRGAGAQETRSDFEGKYEVRALVGSSKHPTLRFLAQGYEEKPLHILPENVRGAEARRINVRLDPLVGKTLVTGRVKGPEGRPVPDAKLSLRSERLKVAYTGVSDERGAFSIPDVKIASDYVLKVRSPGVYADYFERFLAPTREGLALEIVLERLSAARLSGRMVNADGDAVPDFRLSLRSTQASDKALAVTSDHNGYFLVEEAPVGKLTFSTPGFVVRGFSLGSGAEGEVRLVLDWGDHVLRGAVVDALGRALAGARVDLSWVHESAGLISGSSRRRQTDASGSFEFKELGPGPHTLEVHADGHPTTRESYPVRRRIEEVEIRLAPSPR
jgi:hypothetical protein